MKQSPIETLSDRELEVFRLIGQGLSPAQLAAELHLSRHTVDTHKQRIKEKLGLATATELTQAAVRWVIEEKCGEPNETTPLWKRLGSPTGARALVGLIDRRRVELQSEARALGERLFAERSAQRADPFCAYWGTWSRRYSRFSL